MDNKRKERTTLFVGDLSSVCTEADLEQAFSVYGQVQQVRIQRNRMTMASMAYGFVRMTNPVEAINAKNALDGTLLCGRKLRVREAEYGVGGADKGFLRKYSLYIKFESTEEGKKTNEVKIRDIFSQYGEVSDISLRKIFFDKHTGLQKGYGFIHFSNSSEGIQASFNVIADIPQIIVEGVIYVIEASNNLKSRIDAIVQDTPEAASELSDAKAFILNSGSSNQRGSGNRNQGGYNNNHGYGGRGHRGNRNHNNGYDTYNGHHGDGMQQGGYQGQGGMQMNSNGEMEWIPNMHHQGGMNNGYNCHGQRGYNNNNNNDNGGYGYGYNNYDQQSSNIMQSNEDEGQGQEHRRDQGSSSQLDIRSKPFLPSSSSGRGAPNSNSAPVLNPNVQEFRVSGTTCAPNGGPVNSNFNQQQHDARYGGNGAANDANANANVDNFQQYNNNVNGGNMGFNGNSNYNGGQQQNYPDGHMNFGGYMGSHMNTMGGGNMNNNMGNNNNSYGGNTNNGSYGGNMNNNMGSGMNMNNGGYNVNGGVYNMPMSNNNMPMNGGGHGHGHSGDFSTDNWLNMQQQNIAPGHQSNLGGSGQGFYLNPNQGMNNPNPNPPMPPFNAGGRPHGGMGDWNNNNSNNGIQSATGSQHHGSGPSSAGGSFDESPSLGPILADRSPIYGSQNNSLSSADLMLNSLEQQGRPLRHSSSISSADETEIARMLGSLDVANSSVSLNGTDNNTITRAKSGSVSSSGGGTGGLSLDSFA